MATILNNIKNFKGFSYLTKEDFGISESTQLIVNSKINPDLISTIVTGKGLTGVGNNNNPLRINFDDLVFQDTLNPFSIGIKERGPENAGSTITFNEDNFVVYAASYDDNTETRIYANTTFSTTGISISFDTNTNNVVTNTGTLTFNADGITVNGHAPNTASGFVKLDANAKLAPSMIPDISNRYSTVTIETVQKTLASYNSSGIVTIDDLEAGFIISILDDERKQIYPDISYDNNNVATITANFGSETVDTTWTIIKTKSLV